MDLALYATDDADGFTEVCLGMPRRMHQRHEHLLWSLQLHHTNRLRLAAWLAPDITTAIVNGRQPEQLNA